MYVYTSFMNTYQAYMLYYWK